MKIPSVTYRQGTAKYTNYNVDEIWVEISDQFKLQVCCKDNETLVILSTGQEEELASNEVLFSVLHARGL